jgi:hypothetical protein
MRPWSVQQKFEGRAGTVLPELLAEIQRQGGYDASRAMLVCDEDEYIRVVAGMRASDCPILDTPGDDDQPCFAEIYVDQVPQDAMKILVELRRLLGKSWPFSNLRTMLAAQPIHVATRDVAELRAALTAAPRLRPYLFHDSCDELVPVWPDS